METFVRPRTHERTSTREILPYLKLRLLDESFLCSFGRVGRFGDFFSFALVLDRNTARHRCGIVDDRFTAWFEGGLPDRKRMRDKERGVYIFAGKTQLPHWSPFLRYRRKRNPEKSGWIILGTKDGIEYFMRVASVDETPDQWIVSTDLVTLLRSWLERSLKSRPGSKTFGRRRTCDDYLAETPVTRYRFHFHFLLPIRRLAEIVPC